MGILVEYLGPGILGLHIISSDSVELEEPGIVGHILDRIGEEDADVWILGFNPFGTDYPESGHRGDRSLYLGVSHEPCVSRFESDPQDVVLVPAVQPHQVEMVVELVLPGSHGQLTGLVWIAVVYHLTDLLDRKFLSQGDGSAHARLVRGSRGDRDVIQGQDRLLDGDQEVERESLELRRTDLVDLVQTQFSGVGLPWLERPVLGNELNRALGKPSGCSFDRRGESEYTLFDIGSWSHILDVGGQFHPDRGLV